MRLPSRNLLPGRRAQARARPQVADGGGTRRAHGYQLPFEIHQVTPVVGGNRKVVVLQGADLCQPHQVASVRGRGAEHSAGLLLEHHQAITVGEAGLGRPGWRRRRRRQARNPAATTAATTQAMAGQRRLRQVRRLGGSGSSAGNGRSGRLPDTSAMPTSCGMAGIFSIKVRPHPAQRAQEGPMTEGRAGRLPPVSARSAVPPSLSSTNSTCVGVVPMFSPAWVWAGSQ